MRLSGLAGALAALLMAAASVGAAPASAPPGPSLVVSADGRTLQDTARPLVWLRCPLGLRPHPARCAGDATLLNFAQAQAQARQMAASGPQAWRLPTVTELRRLTNQLRSSREGRELLASLALPADRPCWSGSRVIHTGAVNPYTYDSVELGVTGRHREGLLAGQVWTVNLLSSEAQELSREARLPVLLVAPAR